MAHYNLFLKNYNHADEDKAMEDEIITQMYYTFKDIKYKLKVHSTGKLWIQFMDLGDHLHESHQAQRRSHFMLYLKSLQK